MLAIEISILLRNTLHLSGITSRLKQTTAHNLKGLFSGYRLPYRLNPSKIFLQRIQRLLPHSATHFQGRLRQGSQQHGIGYRLHRFSQRLNKGYIGVEGSGIKLLAHFQLAQKSHQLIHQHHTGGRLSQQFD